MMMTTTASPLLRGKILSGSEHIRRAVPVPEVARKPTFNAG